MRWNLKETGCEEYTNSRANLWSDEQKSHIQSKERYDARYKNLTSGGILLDEYEAGDIFKIGDKEYILSENHTLDIPYGEDIYNWEYPSNYKFGKKVE